MLKLLPPRLGKTLQTSSIVCIVLKWPATKPSSAPHECEERTCVRIALYRRGNGPFETVSVVRGWNPRKRARASSGRVGGTGGQARSEVHPWGRTWLQVRAARQARVAGFPAELARPKRVSQLFEDARDGVADVRARAQKREHLLAARDTRVRGAPGHDAEKNATAASATARRLMDDGDDDDDAAAEGDSAAARRRGRRRRRRRRRKRGGHRRPSVSPSSSSSSSSRE